MAHRKQEKRHTRVVATNAFQRKDLSLAAKGVLIYLLTKPKGWKAQLFDITEHNTNGRDANRSAIKQLVDAGYMRRKHKKGDDGKWDGSYYEFSDMPLSALKRYVKPTATRVTDPLRLSKIFAQLFPEPWMDGLYKQNYGQYGFPVSPFSSVSIQ